jgi:hypothetical protein
MTYRCGWCGNEKPRDDLLRVIVGFQTIKPVKLVRQRTLGWICGNCRENHPNWNVRPYSSPGMNMTKQEEARDAG